MGKIAFISDIHGNFPALQAVWADIKSRGISEIYCLGDLVGYYCQINEVISFIRDNHIPCLMGNHDYALCYNEGKITRSKTCTSILKSQLSFISITNLYFLRTLPLSFHLSLESHSFWCMHGGPNDPIDEYFNTKVEIGFSKSALGVSHLVTAHSHIPEIKFLGDVCYANSGSVGQPRDYINTASYLLFEKGAFEVLRVPYDIDSIVTCMKENGYPEYISSILYRGCRIGE